MWELDSQPINIFHSYPLNSVKNKLVKLSVSMKEGDKEQVYVMPLLN